uniref:Natural cytotoxicity triggering receptor 3 n=1 Tax=Ginglymostoma cirratum TaxID=7801 RepID=A0A8A9WQH2_GINCI|nr:natural cytotoxicity triggering receptor 3 [Ginglymostoma cirratum]
MNTIGLLWTSILLLTTDASKFQVYQEPLYIEATEGETAHFLCTYNASHDQVVGAFSWHKDIKNGTGDAKVTNKSAKFLGRIIQVDRPSFRTNGNASIAITNLKQDDSGIYYCQVILFFEEEFGPGTRLTVKCRQPLMSSRRSLLWQMILTGLKLAVFSVCIIITISLAYF